MNKGFPAKEGDKRTLKVKRAVTKEHRRSGDCNVTVCSEALRDTGGRGRRGDRECRMGPDYEELCVYVMLRGCT